GGYTIDTGAARFELGRTGFPFGDIVPKGGVRFESPRLRVLTSTREACTVVPGRALIEESGPIRTTALVEASIRSNGGRRLLDAFARIQFFAGSATVHVDLTVRNPRRAAHPGGFWELGDAGSVLIEEAVLEFPLGSAVDGVRCSVERGAPLESCAMPF